jgi:putative PEP-CTERM system TPR-repeat lipoprotein
MRGIDMNTGRTMWAAVASAMLVVALLTGCSDKPDALIASAKQSLAKNDRNTAIIHLKNGLLANPDLGEARLLLGKTLLETGDFAAAEKELRRARELKVPDEQVVPFLARAMYAQGEFKNVIEQFGKVELTAPEARADLASTLGQVQIGVGNADAAWRMFAEAQKAVPGYPAAMLGESRLKATSGDLAGALTIVDAALEKSPKLAEGWALKGDIAGAQGQVDSAVAAYRKGLELHPDDVLIHSRLTSLLIQQKGVSKEASEQLEAMKKIAPKHPQTHYLQAVLAYRDRNYVAAREAIQLNLRAYPDNLAGLVLDGSIAYQLGSFGQAEASLQKALQQAPKQRLARVMLVNTYLRNRQPAKALETLRPLLEDADRNADVLALAGEVYMQNGNTKEAERVFAKASALDPKDASKRTLLALTHRSTGDADRGFRELEEAAATDKGIRADLALIAAYSQQRNFDAALKAIADLEKKQPDKPLPHNLRGAVYANKGDFAAARRSFERAGTLDPADFEAAAGLAKLDLIEKKPDDARKRFEAVVAKDPRSTRALLALAELRAQAGGTTDEVATLIGKAVSADSTSVGPRLVLINHYMRSKEPKKAVAAAQDALAAMPDRIELVDAAGQAQMAAGDTNQAIAAFQKLAKLVPGAPEPYIRLAGAQIAGKDPDGAVQSLKKALAMKPDLINAQRAMMKLNLDAGREAEAMSMAREVQKQRPKESVGYMMEGDIYASKKAWTEAIAVYRNGLKNVSAGDLATRLDVALRASGNVAEAEKSTAAWLRDHPKDRVVRAYIAELALARGDYAAAVTHYKSLLDLYPADPAVLNNLAYVSGQLKDPKALEYAEKANKLAPNNAAILDTLGMLLVEQGDSKRGVELMQRAAELAPAATSIRLNLARALIKNGQKEAAKKELETLAKLGDRFAGQAEVTKLMQGL